MMKSKSLIAVLFCCALFVCKPAKAFWPTFDFVEFPGIVSQVSTSVEAFKNLKEQITELKNNLSAIGDKINGIAAFTKDISNKVTKAANSISKIVDDVNKTLGTDINIGQGLKNAVDGVKDATNAISNAAVASTEYISGATSKMEAGTTLIGKVENLGTKAESALNKQEAKKEDKKNDTATTTTPSTSTSLDTISVKKLNPVNNRELLPSAQKLLIEEEEEEEEVSPEEDQQRIDTIKENIELILSETNSLSVQLNDLMDISLNTVHKNFEYNQESLEKVKYIINRARDIDEKDKVALLKSLEEVKQKQENTSKRLVEMIEAVKDNYNQEYNSKVVNGYKNYEKVAIAYIKGDATQEEMKEAGANLRKSVASINVSPDSSVIQSIEKSIKTMQEDLIVLKDNVKKAEDKKTSKV